MAWEHPPPRTCGMPLHLHPVGPSSCPTSPARGHSAGDALVGEGVPWTRGVCRRIQRSAVLQPSPRTPSSPGRSPYFTDCSAALSQTHSLCSPPAAGSSRRRLSRGCPVPRTPREKNAALQKRGRNKAEKSSFVLFSFLGHFELIKECDLNYKYPPSRMIYGLFVLDWYVLNL